jgi:outer membrane protein insertion porin family
MVNLRWDIRERQQSIVNRIDITGNSFTRESCIRQQLTVFPGSVFSQDRLMQSLQRIQAMGFFEDLQSPQFEPVNDSLGLLNLIINVTEKKTGSVNFGASMGGAGGGLGGFVGFDQPNLFGQCKRGSLNWQFGSLVKEFNISYSDPAIRKSQFSGSANLYHMNARYTVAEFGRQTRTGGYLRVGFPFLGSYYTRAFVSYGGEAVKYSGDPNSLLGQLANDCDNCFRSTVGFNLTRDTRLGMPFPSAGVYQTLDAQINGGILGGTANFRRYSTELRSYVPLGTVGGDQLAGTQPIQISMGISLRAGTVFGSTGPFFPTQEFSMGGVQQGETLRGYDEFTITPGGYVTDGSALQARRESFGKAFMSATAEVGARISQTVYTSVFFDAGNVWRNAQDFNPTRMFRGAGAGIALVTPLGPLGLDYAYGFDKLDAFGKPDPGWKLHFKLGQIF